MMKVKVIGQTAKAKLVVSAAGQKAWVQNRSYKNGEVSIRAFSAGVKFQEERMQTKRLTRIDLSKYTKPATDKSEYLSLLLWEEHTDQQVFHKIYLPLSLKQDQGYPNWLISNKREELTRYLKEKYNQRGCFTCDTSRPVFNGCY